MQSNVLLVALHSARVFVAATLQIWMGQSLVTGCCAVRFSWAGPGRLKISSRVVAVLFL